MSRLSLLCLAGFVLLAISGLLSWLLPGEQAFVLPLVQGHVGLGFAVAIAGPVVLGAHLARTGSALRGPAAAFGAGIALSLPAILGVEGGEDSSLPAYIASNIEGALGGEGDAAAALLPVLCLAVLTLLTAGLSVGAQLRPLGTKARSRWSGSALALLAGWASMTGLAQPYVHRDALFMAIGAHSVGGLACALLLVHHLIAPRLHRAGSPSRRTGLVTLAITAGVLLAMLGLTRWEQGAGPERRSVPGVLEASSTANASERSSAARGEWPHLPAAAVRDSMSCGEAGCHPVLTEEWAGSPHRFAASNLLYRAAVDGMVERGELDSTSLCANCHDPDRVLTGGVPLSYRSGVPAGGSDGVSCISCHAMVETGARPGNGVYTVATRPPTHPSSATQVARIRLDPRAHLRLMAIDEYTISPRPCGSCHRLELGPDHGLDNTFVLQDVTAGEASGNEGVECQHCHLPVMPREFDQYAHRMPGINADLARYAGTSDPKDAARLRAQSEAAIQRAGLVAIAPIEAASFPVEPDLVNPAHPERRERRALALRVSGELQGDRVALRVRTLNRGVGHDFPAGPLDLQEIWLETRITDASGRVLSHRGLLDEEGRVSDPAARLGARELDREGQPLREHRLTELASIEDKRVLPYRGSLLDLIEVPLPDDVLYPLDVRARWLFRRANPSFTAFALGPDADPLPAWELVGARIEVAAPQ